MSHDPCINLNQLKPRDFRLYLQQELVRRCDSNKRYSLRAFANALGENHATLSSILSGKRPITDKTIIKIGHALKLSQIEISDFIEALGEGSAASKMPAAKDHRVLALDVFNVIADWYHDAILELTHTKNFKADTKWIAKRLGITSAEVAAAKERLERLELLEVKNGKWLDCSRNNTTNLTNDLTSAALRKLQAKILELSNEALRDLPRTKRDHTSLIVAMQSSDLAAIKERIKQFRFELAEFIERKGAKPDAVYQFAFAVFPLTKED